MQHLNSKFTSSPQINFEEPHDCSTDIDESFADGQDQSLSNGLKPIFKIKMDE